MPSFVDRPIDNPRGRAAVHHLVVPADCVASNTEEENRHALEQMRKVLKADTRPSVELSLEELGRRR